MSPQQIAQLLQDRFGNKILSARPDDKHPRVHIEAANWREVAEFLRHDPALKFDWLANLSGVDYVADKQFCVVYDLWSFDHDHRFAVKVYAPRSDDTHFPSCVDLWPTAEWHEREAFDLLGIFFDGHPDLRRILLADDWEGFPLRKDYVFPREYHGIPGSVELDWQQKPNYP
ncbi:MAG: NADH-quinone oxidoreductase subunit [Phycisphaerales bacterium]|nr:NADH-quinone oxidoreductase subunit [Phycisphaerales bacterium]